MITDVVVNGNVILNVNLVFGNHVTGFIRDTTGAGLPDLDINAYYESNGQAVTLMNDNTDLDGSYDVLLPTALLRLVYRPVMGENLVPVELRYVNIHADTTINIVMRAGYLISGTVTGPGGLPVVGADIDAEDSFTGVKLYTPGDNTDNNGHYQIRVPAGTYNVNVEPLQADHLVPEIVYNFAVSGNIALNFALDAGFILSGTVRNSLMAPVLGADIDVRIPATGQRLFTPSGNTDSSGSYHVVIPPGIYDVDYKPAVVPPYLAPLRIRNVNVNGDRAQDAIVSNGYLLSGQVLSFRGNGLANVNIDSKDSLNNDVPLVGDNTSANGNFSVVMASGLYSIEIEPGQYSGFSAELLENVRIRIDTSFTVYLDSGLVVSGIVRDSIGGYFPNVSAVARETNTGVQRFSPGNKTDINGYYRIVIPPNVYDLFYLPDSLSGVSDSVVMYDVSVMTDITLDVNFPAHSGDSTAPSVSVISPNGGEEYPAYDVIPITWIASDNVGVAAVDIYYSIDGQSGTFIPIAINHANDGEILWEVPPESTTNAWIKIVTRDASFNSALDLSDGPFAIVYSAFCCGGITGDANGNGQANGIDVVFLVNYLKGGNAPPDTCDCSTHGLLMALADGNGSCQVNGIDVTYMVGFLKGGPGLRCCPDCPQAIISDGNSILPFSR